MVDYSLAEFEAGDSHGGNTLFTPNEAYVFVRGRFDANPMKVHLQGGTDVSLHLFDMRREFRSLGDHRRVHVNEFAAAHCQKSCSFVQEDPARRTSPARVCIRKKVPDVPFPET